MRKRITRLVFTISLITGGAIFLNLQTTTLRGINYSVAAIKIPMYLKLLDFFDRHYNYQNLVKSIIAGSSSGDEKMLKILKWTSENIKVNPTELPVVDDHAWYIIVRGYGVCDQFQDVFSTLCNYAGLRSFFTNIYSNDFKQEIPFSFVCVGRKWFVFDAYKGVYFSDMNNNLLDVGELAKKPWRAVNIKEGSYPQIDYSLFIRNISSTKFSGLSRANIQSPIHRFIYAIARLKSGILKKKK